MAGAARDGAAPLTAVAQDALPATLTGALTLDDGATWTGADIGIGGTLYVAANSSDVPTTLHASGTLALGSGSRLDVGGGSRVSAAALALAAGGGVTLLDGMSGILLGAGTAQAGALTVGAGGVLSGSGGTIVASVVLDGPLDVSGSLALDGVLTGTGSVQVGSGDLAVVDAVAFAGGIALGSFATLTLQQGDAPAAALAMNGATVDLRGIAWGNGLTVTYDTADGLLTLGVATLDVGIGAAARDFSATNDPSGGTLLTEHRAPVWQATAAGAGGDWADASHWGAEGVPLAGDPVAIGPGVTAAGPWTVTVDGHATAERLTLAAGTLAVGGSLGVAGALEVQSGALDVGAAGSVVVGAAGSAVAGAIAVGAGAMLAATDAALGNVAVEGGSVSLRGGGGGTLSGTGMVALDDVAVGAVSGFAGTLAVAGTVTVDSGGAPGGPVRFASSGTAAGLDLRGVAWQAGEAPAYDAASGLLIVGGATLDVGAGLAPAGFAATADAAGGTLITTQSVACFAAGTAILTPDGPVPVERLAVGARVVTRAHPGRWSAPIRWIGRRRIDLARHPHPEAVRPVRIRRDAVAPGVPARDLLLSPDHAVALGGVLIPVKYLVNGTTVAPDPSLAEIVYFHVELEAHDIVLAEALPAETYLDTGNRAAFAEAAGPVALHPGFAAKTWERDACLRLMGDGPAVAAVRAVLGARAAVLSRRGGRAPCARGAPAPRSTGWRSAAPPAA